MHLIPPSVKIMTTDTIIPVASAGIAALLSEKEKGKGMTAHKYFSIPIQQGHSCTPSVSLACNPRPQMMDAFQDCDIIFWDEIAISPFSHGVGQMCSRQAFWWVGSCLSWRF